jgi:hypothetical protein
MNTNLTVLPIGLPWTLRQSWARSGPFRLMTVLAVAAAALAMWSSYATESQQRVAKLQSAVESAALVASAPAFVNIPADFTSRLPEGPQQTADRELAVLQAAADQAGIGIASLQLQTHAAAPDKLGRKELSFVARGRYSSQKRFLAHTVERLGMATVSRLRIQRAEGNDDVEAQVTLSVWFKPARLHDDRGR